MCKGYEARLGRWWTWEDICVLVSLSMLSRSEPCLCSCFSTKLAEQALLLLKIDDCR